MSNVFILNVINSIVGKRGNIGYRLNHVISKQKENDISTRTIARGDITHNKNIFTMGIVAYISRGINYLAKAYFKMLNGRKVDIYLFNMFFLITYFLRIRPFLESRHEKVAHLCESSYFILTFLKKRGFKILLDVPIAPSAYVQRIISIKITEQLVYNQFIDKQERLCFKHADKIIVPSDFVLNELKDIGVDLDKITVIPFGFNQDTNEDVIDNSKDEQSDNLKFCFAGNICHRKGLDTLLRAWNDPCFAMDELHLCGKVFPDIQKLLDKGKFNNVYTPGFVDAYSYFKKCDVYVFPSLMEGSSKSIYEAMSCSLPVITTFESGSIIENSVDGFIFNIGDSKALKNMMLRMKLEPEMRNKMGALGKVKVERYPWSRYSSSVLNCYENIN